MHLAWRRIELGMKRDAILIIHLALLLIALLNFTAKTVLEIGLANQLDTIVKTLIALSGLILFAMYWKPFKTINYYFLIYPISFSLLILGLIFRGLIGGMIVLAILSLFDLNEVEYRKDEITIYSNAQGLMSRCCSYRITERKFIILQKKLGDFENDRPINFQTSKVEKITGGIQLTFPHEYFDENTNSYKIRDKTISLK